MKTKRRKRRPTPAEIEVRVNQKYYMLGYRIIRARQRFKAALFALDREVDQAFDGMGLDLERIKGDERKAMR